MYRQTCNRFAIKFADDHASMFAQNSMRLRMFSTLTSADAVGDDEPVEVRREGRSDEGQGRQYAAGHRH